MKNWYKKNALVVFKIARAAMIALIVALIGLLAAKICLVHLNSQEVLDRWAIYYALWAERILIWLTIVFAVVWVVFSLPTLWPRLKERVRKTVVSLKRNPSSIPLLMLFVTFLFYSLNLTDVSDTTAKIYGKGMGLSQFCIMLFSLLSLVCMLNAFPRRKKANIPMVVLMFAMFGIIIYCDIHYCNMIMAAINRPENPIAITPDTQYIAEAYNMLNVHMVMTIVSAALVVLMPVYSRLLRMINTSVTIEDNGEMGQIEIQD